MLKAKRIAIGGWLNNALSIMTRGWFGGVIAAIPGCTVVTDALLNSLAVSGSLLNTVTLSVAASYIGLSVTQGATITLTAVAQNSIELSEEVCQ